MLIPDRIGRYRIVRLRGTGAASSVFEAHDELLDVPVAVKVLADHLIRREDIVGAFLREARLLRSIEDARVVAVHDIGVLDSGQPYMVMDLLDLSLADRLVGASGDSDAAVRVGRELGAALQVIHDRGLVHLDVKPANVFVQPAELDDGSPFPSGSSLVLGDFGLASQSGELAAGVGTLGYMSPEQGRGGAVDARSDLFALAAVVRRVAIGSGDRPEPLPRSIVRATGKAMADDPAERPSDVTEFVRLLDDEAAGARSRRRWIASIVVILALAAAGVGLVQRFEPSAPVRAIAPEPLLFGAAGIAANGSTIAVADTENHRVVLFDGEEITYVDGLLTPSDVAFDASGRLVVADTGNHRIVAFEDGGLTVLAGGPAPGFSGDGGPAAQALLDSPSGIGLTSGGELLIADTGNRRIRLVDSEGVISTVAGTGLASDSGDGGAATDATFLAPVDVAEWREGIAVADRQAHRVRWIDSSGVIDLLAGDGAPRSTGDGGLASVSSLAAPTALTLGNDGSLLVAESSGGVRAVEPSGTIRTRVASEDRAGVSGVAVGPSGRIYLTVSGKGDVLEVENGRIEVLLEGDPSGPIGDGGAAIAASLVEPTAVGVRAEVLLVADSGHSAIRSVDLQGDATISTAARVGGVGTIADIDVWNDRAVLALPDSHQVVVVDLALGVRSPLAGSGRSGDRGDGGLAPEALMRKPVAVAVGPGGEVYVVDADSHRVRVVDTDGVISTLIGSGEPGSVIGSGSPSSSELQSPSDVAVESDGTVWVADAGNGRVLTVSDGVVQVQATGLDDLVSIAISDGRVYVAANGAIGRIDTGSFEVVIDTGRRVSLAAGPTGLLVVDRCAGTVSVLEASELNPIAGRPIRSCS